MNYAKVWEGNNLKMEWFDPRLTTSKFDGEISEAMLQAN